MPLKIAIVLFIVAVPLYGLAALQSPSDFEHGLVRYASTEPSDPVARLQKRIDAGEVTLAFDRDWGYLPAVLAELRIPRSSQSLVFSNTSLQLLLISPENPRALYFNDDVYVGSVWGGPIMEIASVDPQLGTVFYTLPQKEDASPRFEREYFACLLCHDSKATAGVPGLTLLSVIPDRRGKALPAGASGVDDRTPFKDRWGGWYVTGLHGEERHRGNMMSSSQLDTIRDPQAFIARLDLNAGANVTSLDKYFDAGRYLTPASDLVALTVMAHQTRVHNLITKAAYDVRTAVHEDKEFAGSLRSADGTYSDLTRSRIHEAVEPLVRAMLFAWAAEWTSPISGTTKFADEFMSAGLRDRRGRSLRDVDLTTRLFKYPLSYLIYSDPFDALPDAAKAQFYARLDQILAGGDSKDFDHLSASDRQAILEILEDTKPEFQEARRNAAARVLK